MVTLPEEQVQQALADVGPNALRRYQAAGGTMEPERFADAAASMFRETFSAYILGDEDRETAWCRWMDNAKLTADEAHRVFTALDQEAAYS